MKYEDLSFTMVNEDGEELINDILSIVPNERNTDEPYVVFTDYTLDAEDEFIKKYGRLGKKNNEYYIETNLSKEEIDYIKKGLEDEIVKYVNDVIEENLHG